MRGARGGLAALALVAAGGAAAPAAAHITIAPGASRPGDLQRYRVLVPTEEDSDVLSVDMRMPPGFTFVLVEQKAGFSARVVRKNDAVSEIRWRGRVPPEAFAELRFIARNPVKPGQLAFKAVQRYANGSVARWIGPPDAESPAPVVELSETATPVDIVSTDGEKLPTAAATPAAATTGAKGDADEAGDPDRDGLTLGLAIGGLVLGAAGVALGARRKAG